MKQNFDMVVFALMAFNVALEIAIERAAKELNLDPNQTEFYADMVRRKVNIMNNIRG